MFVQRNLAKYRNFTRQKSKLTLYLLLGMLFVSICFQINATDTPSVVKYIKLEKVDIQTVDSTCYSVKAVIANSDNSRIYTANLEAMNVYEFDRVSRKVLRKLVFVANPGKGFNYQKKVWFNSYQEKPVEECLTHNGRFLWLSLHNAGGVVIWDLTGGETYVEGKPYKEAWLNDISGPTPTKKKLRLLWIKTGTTPKIITATPDGKYLFVANWHSNSISVIAIDSPDPKDWVKIKDIAPSPIPRGMVVSPDSKYLYVAQMGGDFISIIDLANFQKIREISVGVNPRHIIINNNYCYSSLEISSKLVKIDLSTNKIVKIVPTQRSPRTIAITPDGKIIFVTCYIGNYFQAFDADNLSLLGSWQCYGNPVAVTVYQKDDEIEAWVGNEGGSTVKVFTFKEVNI
jgi:YVTN family beta-propeller protein